MLSQSSRLYLERKGVIPTRRSYHRPVLDPDLNIARYAAVIMPPSAQLVITNNNSPDMAGGSITWPAEEPTNGK